LARPAYPNDKSESNPPLDRIVGIGLGAEAPFWNGIALVVSTTALSILGHLAYALALSTAPVVAFYRHSRRWIEASLGVFFSVAAFKIVTYKT